jgi:hypothetical protein
MSNTAEQIAKDFADLDEERQQQLAELAQELLEQQRKEER